MYNANNILSLVKIIIYWVMYGEITNKIKYDGLF